MRTILTVYVMFLRLPKVSRTSFHVINYFMENHGRHAR